MQYLHNIPDFIIAHRDRVEVVGWTIDYENQ